MSDVTELSGQILKYIDNRNVRLGFGAFVLSALSTLTITAIVSVKYNKDDGITFAVPDEYRIALILAFFIVLVASWFILYLLSYKDSTDVYSELREKIEGKWVLTYDANTGHETGVEVAPTRSMPCEMLISPEKKLYMAFKLEEHPHFKNTQQYEFVRDLALRYNEEGGYTMMYYYKSTRELRTNYAYILNGNGLPMRTIDVEIFGYVKFDKPRGKDTIRNLNGTWFDLNGNMSRLYNIIETKHIADIRKEDLHEIMFYSALPHKNDFDADMGTVSFSR